MINWDTEKLALVAGVTNERVVVMGVERLGSFPEATLAGMYLRSDPGVRFLIVKVRDKHVTIDTWGLRISMKSPFVVMAREPMIFDDLDTAIAAAVLIPSNTSVTSYGDVPGVSNYFVYGNKP